MNNRPLTPHEFGFVALDGPTTPQVVSCYCPLSRGIDPEVLRDRIAQVAQDEVRLRSRVVRGQRGVPTWLVEDELDLDAVFHTDSLVIDDERAAVAAALQRRRAITLLDGPVPWEVRLATFTHGSAEATPPAALLFSAHHALVDGLAGLSLLARLLGDERPGLAEAPTERAGPRCTTACWRGVARDQRQSAPKSCLSGTNSPERTAFTRTLARCHVVAARRLWDASAQEVLLVTLADALRRYAEASDKQPAPLRAILPLAPIRGRGELNHHDPGQLLLPHTEDPIERLDVVRRGLESLRDDQRNDVFGTLLAFSQLLPRSLQAWMARNWTSRASILVSVLPGPRRMPLIDEAEVTGLFALPALGTSHGLSVGIVARSDAFDLAVQVDPGVVDPSRLSAAFDAAIAALARPAD